MLSPELITWDGLDVPAIEDAYNLIAPTIAGKFPDKETRENILGLMKANLPDYDIKCDEENNPPNVVDSGHVMVRVSTKPKQDGLFNYVDVIF